MKLTLELPENPGADTRVFELPEGTWRFVERRMSDGRLFTSVSFIHGEKQDMDDLAQHLLTAEKAEAFIRYGEQAVMRDVERTGSSH